MEVDDLFSQVNDIKQLEEKDDFFVGHQGKRSLPALKLERFAQELN